MIVSISGTPGTGKTTSARILTKQLNANLISIRALLKEVKHGWDKERKTKVVDVKDLQKAVSRQVIKDRINIIEGHLSHLLDADIVIVLRCRPPELEKHLKRKGWKKDKIRENLEAEILDEITIEAVEEHGERKVFEIDTSDKAAKETAAITERILNNFDAKKYRAGKIDWSEEYKNYLIK